MNRDTKLIDVIKKYHEFKKFIIAINVQNIEHIKIISSIAKISKEPIIIQFSSKFISIDS